MKIKSDFVTNSSSTSFMVVDTWEIKSGSMLISQNFNEGLEVFDISRLFLAYIYKLTDHQAIPNFGIEKHDDHLQLSFEAPKNDCEDYILKYDIIDDGSTKEVYLYGVDFTMNVYNDKSVEASFHYSTSHSADEIKKAISKMIEDIVDMLRLAGLEIEGERRVLEFNGDGWDGGDPCFGHYGESDVCKEEVEGEYKLTIK
jgi:hypothetical protein